MSAKEFTVTLTADDHAFTKLAVRHYRLFAEVSEKQGDARTAGILRSQEFHAEQMLARLNAARESQP